MNVFTEAPLQKVSLVLILMSLAQSPAAHEAGASAAGAWNFTPAKYSQLVANGGRLRFESDSAWFPKALQRNLSTTLAYALNPGLQPSSTDGVSLRDFYHGHIGCPRPNGLGELRQQAMEKRDRIFAENGKPRVEDFEAYVRAVKAAEEKYGLYLRAALKLCRSAVVVYHTFEYNAPRDMRVGDPRRNIITRLAINHPHRFQPPDVDNASSWTDQFSEILQFAFLVDESGVVHVTFGTTGELSKVVGYPLQN